MLPAMCGSETLTTVVSRISIMVAHITATATIQGFTSGWDDGLSAGILSVIILRTGSSTVQRLNVAPELLTTIVHAERIVCSGDMMLQVWCVRVIAAVLSVSSVLWAQSSTGEIDVSVADASEAAVLDARVTITG